MYNKPTIADVAKLAGVSLGTASHAINNKKGVATSTIAKVREAVQKLDYYPSIAARQLRGKKSNIVSLYIPIPETGKIHHSTWTFYFPIIQGFMDKIKKKGFRIHLEFINMEELAYFSHLESFVLGYQVHGTAFILPYKGDFSGIYRLAEIGIPVVTIYSKINDSISSVRTDNFNASKIEVEWLMSLGHKNIGFISGGDSHFASNERKEGYLAGMNKSSYKNIYQGNWTIKSGIEGLKYFITQKEHPTAIFCANDHMAIGVLKACRDLQISIPHDISIVGFDDNFICQVSDPQLTSTKMPLYEMGQESASILLSKSNINNKRIEHQIIHSKLVIRNSAISVMNSQNNGKVKSIKY